MTTLPSSLTEEQARAIAQYWHDNQTLTRAEVVHHWRAKLGWPVTGAEVRSAMARFQPEIESRVPTRAWFNNVAIGTSFEIRKHKERQLRAGDWYLARVAGRTPNHQSLYVITSRSESLRLDYAAVRRRVRLLNTER